MKINHIIIKVIILSALVSVLSFSLYSCMQGGGNTLADPTEKQEKDTVSDELALHMAKNAISRWETIVLKTYSPNTGNGLKSTYDNQEIKYNKGENTIEIPVVFTWKAKTTLFSFNYITCRMKAKITIELNFVKDGKTKVSLIGLEEENVSILLSENLNGNAWERWTKGTYEYMVI